MPEQPIQLMYGEKKKLTFTITDSAGDPYYVADATFRFVLKENKTDDDYLRDVADANFDKSEWNATDAKVKVVLDTAESTALEVGKTYWGELKTVFDASNHTDKSTAVAIEILQAVSHD